MRLLGPEGYRRVVSQFMENTYYLLKKMKEYSFESVIDPVLNIVAIRDEDPVDTSLKLREVGWYLSTCRCVEALRVVVMPHITREHIDKFIEALAQCKKR